MPTRCVPNARRRCETNASNLSQEIIRWTQKEVFAIARKTLADLATTSLEERMGEVFVRRLRALDGEAKGAVGDRPQDVDPTRRVVRSAFDLPPAQRAAIENAVKETFAADVHVQFETAPELVSGIELSANGQKVAWSIADYLATLEKSVGELLQGEDRAQAKPRPKPQAESEAEAEA